MNRPSRVLPQVSAKPRKDSPMRPKRDLIHHAAPVIEFGLTVVE